MSIYTTPYTYLVRHKPTGKRYYGVRFARGCHPNDLWESYFTSSKIVHQLIEQDGVDAFEYEIRRTFNKRRDAREWENRVLRRMRVIHSDQWFNQTDNKAIINEVHPWVGRKHKPESIEKMRQSSMGVGKGKVLSAETRRKISEAQKGKIITEEQRAKMRGPRPKMRDRKLSPEHRAAISRSKMGVKRPDVIEKWKDSPRNVAKEKGERYYIGKPCPNCGATLRYVSSYGCIACADERGRIRHGTNV